MKNALVIHESRSGDLVEPVWKRAIPVERGRPVSGRPVDGRGALNGPISMFDIDQSHVYPRDSSGGSSPGVWKRGRGVF